LLINPWHSPSVRSETSGTVLIHPLIPDTRISLKINMNRDSPFGYESIDGLMGVHFPCGMVLNGASKVACAFFLILASNAWRMCKADYCRVGGDDDLGQVLEISVIKSSSHLQT
jgi:hypothetical protein